MTVRKKARSRSLNKTLTNAARELRFDRRTVKKLERLEKLPRKVRIGYADFDIIPIPHEEATLRGEDGITGHVFVQRHLINYDETINDVELANTIIHEALHGVVHMYGMNFKTAKFEEDAVNTIANGLTSLIRDNPNLFHWLIEMLGEKQK